jgi:hypothetical protein
VAAPDPSLGLTCEELRRYARQAVAVASAGNNDELIEYVTPSELSTRRIAWEAAAALTAANNRRLTEQLRRLGLLTDANWAAIADLASEPADASGSGPSH